MKYLYCVLMMFCILSASASIQCECGSFRTGIYKYFASGPGCCSSAPDGGGILTKYILNEGQWVEDGWTSVGGEAAQAACCVVGFNPNINF